MVQELLLIDDYFFMTQMAELYISTLKHYSINWFLFMELWLCEVLVQSPFITKLSNLAIPGLSISFYWNWRAVRIWAEFMDGPALT